MHRTRRSTGRRPGPRFGRAGPVSLAVGFVQLAADPAAAHDLSGQLVFVGPLVVQCLVLAVLASLPGWLLRRTCRDQGEVVSTPTIDDCEQ